MSGEEGSAGSESVAAVTADTSSSSQRSTGSNSKLLCGYLNKLSGKGPLRGFKKRWFIHSSSDCKLKYYRAKGDLVPLGEIDIRRATFTITPVTGSHSSSLVFSIVTLDKEFVLEGVDQETSLFWIKELQRLRKEYIVNLASDFGIKLTIPSLDDGVGEPQITEVKNTRSNSRFYTNEDLSDELNQSVILQPKRSVTDDSLNRRLSRAPAAAPSPSGFTSALFSRVRNRAESLTRGNGQSKGAFCEKCREKDDQLVSMASI